MQTLAFETFAEDENLTAEIRVRLISEIARAAGTPLGMVAGQALDLQAEKRTVGSAELERIHRAKTGAMIVAAARCGAIIGGASEKEYAAVSDFAEHLGLLFRMICSMCLRPQKI